MLNQDCVLKIKSISQTLSDFLRSEKETFFFFLSDLTDDSIKCTERSKSKQFAYIWLKKDYKLLIMFSNRFLFFHCFNKLSIECYEFLLSSPLILNIPFAIPIFVLSLPLAVHIWCFFQSCWEAVGAANIFTFLTQQAQLIIVFMISLLRKLSVLKCKWTINLSKNYLEYGRNFECFLFLLDTLAFDIFPPTNSQILCYRLLFPMIRKDVNTRYKHWKQKQKFYSSARDH